MRRRNKNRAESEPDRAAIEGDGEELELVIETELDEATQQVFDTLRARMREAEDGRKRAMADFVNFQRRAHESERIARREGIVSVVRSLMPVLDNLDLALGQNLERATLEQVMKGVEMLRHQLLDAMGALGVSRIAPEPGEVFDPTRHQAVAQQPNDEIDPGRVMVTAQAGFVMQDVVLRPASVVVVTDPGPGPGRDDDDSDDDDDGGPRADGGEQLDDAPKRAPEPIVYDITDAGDDLEQIFGDRPGA